MVGSRVGVSLRTLSTTLAVLPASGRHPSQVQIFLLISSTLLPLRSPDEPAAQDLPTRAIVSLAFHASHPGGYLWTTFMRSMRFETAMYDTEGKRPLSE